MALSRLPSTDGNPKKNSRVADEYRATIQAYVEKEYLPKRYPMESQFVPQENAPRNQDRYPLATETVLKSTFMDDSIDCVENDEESY